MVTLWSGGALQCREKVGTYEAVKSEFPTITYCQDRQQPASVDVFLSTGFEMKILWRCSSKQGSLPQKYPAYSSTDVRG